MGSFSHTNQNWGSGSANSRAVVDTAVVATPAVAGGLGVAELSCRPNIHHATIVRMRSPKAAQANRAAGLLTRKSHTPSVAAPPTLSVVGTSASQLVLFSYHAASRRSTIQYSTHTWTS